MIGGIIDWINQNPVPSIVIIQITTIVFGIVKLVIEYRRGSNVRIDSSDCAECELRE